MMTSSNGDICHVTGLFCAGNSPVPGEFPSQSQWRLDLMFSLICVWTNSWINNRDVGYLRRHRDHYYVTVMHWLSVQNKTLHKIALATHIFMSCTANIQFSESSKPTEWWNGNQYSAKTVRKYCTIQLITYATCYITDIRHSQYIQYIPRNMHTVFASLCFVVVRHWFSHIHQAYFTGTVAI